MTYIVSHYISHQRLSRVEILQVADGRCVVDDRRGNGRAWLRRQFPERLPVETGEGEGDAAGLVERDDPPPLVVEEFVQFDQVAGDV